jgi:hypothetical protein
MREVRVDHATPANGSSSRAVNRRAIVIPDFFAFREVFIIHPRRIDTESLATAVLDRGVLLHGDSRYRG